MNTQQNTTPLNSNNPDQLLNVKQVAALLSVGKSTVWCWTKTHRLPQPRKFGTRCSRWRLGDILDAVYGSDNGDAA